MSLVIREPSAFAILATAGNTGLVDKNVTGYPGASAFAILATAGNTGLVDKNVTGYPGAVRLRHPGYGWEYRPGR